MQDFKQTITDFDTNLKTSQQFGLRNLVKQISGEFKPR
jgi:hypothetical protein